MRSIVIFLLIIVSASTRTIPPVETLTQQPIYLLITTSSKIYSLPLPNSFQIDNFDMDKFYTENNVIYKEPELSNNWITDAFYVKSENLIYVNVYNSTSASSDIFTLKYNKETNTYIKTVLYNNQRFCLGITYNEAKKELYWIDTKSVIVGSSKPNGTQSVLYELSRAKKLLYLKYNSLTDKLYVSTLNYVYECDLGDQDFTQSMIYTQRCRIIVRSLISARGLYLDSQNRFLYVVDHKKRNIDKVNLSAKDINGSKTSFVSQEKNPEIGDVFNMIVYNQSNSEELLILSEFSGQIKVAKMSDTGKLKLMFKTNEYTYSVNLMDNSTEEITDTVKTTATKTSSVSTVKSSTIVATRGLPLGWRYVKESKESEDQYDYDKEIDFEPEERVISLESKSLVEAGPRKYLVPNQDLNDDVDVESDDSDKLITVSSTKRLSFLRSSTHLNAALYVVICLLCFSLLINIILLYISKMKHNKSKHLVISHEICDIGNMPSKRCGSAATKSTSGESCGSNDCNLNLINSSGNSTSGLDSDHS